MAGAPHFMQRSGKSWPDRSGSCSITRAMCRLLSITDMDRLAGQHITPASEVHGGLIAQDHGPLTLEAAKHVTQGLGKGLGSSRFAGCVGSGEGTAQDALLIQFLLIMKTQTLRVLEERTVQENLTRAAARTFDGGSIRCHADHRAVGFGAGIGFVALIPDQ